MDTVGIENMLQERGGGIVNLRFEGTRWQAQIVLTATETLSSHTASGSGETLEQAVKMALSSDTSGWNSGASV